MSITIDKVDHLLSDFQSVLDELVRLQTEKLDALASMDAPTLERLAAREEELVSRLAEVSRFRGQLVGEPDAELPPAQSLRQVVQWLPDTHRRRLLDRLNNIRALAHKVKQQACANWLVAYRNNQHLHRLLEIIAHAGQSNAGDGKPGAGLLLDRTA
jgi:flagellar biosynthesis/type III secretory pathway chaperone